MHKTPELYNIWNEEKKKLELHEKPKITHIGEIWLMKIGVNIGNEISKDTHFMRPVLIASRPLG